MRFRSFTFFLFLFCMISFYSCYHPYADYVEDIEISYNDGNYYLIWSPVAKADSYIVYAQTEYKNSDNTSDIYLKIVAETIVPECVISIYSIPYNCEVLRIVAVHNGQESYLSKKIELGQL